MVKLSLPTSVQFTPFVERQAVIVFPRRSSLTRAGATPAPPDVCVDWPAVARRRWKASPLPGDTSISACGESLVSASRIITPALTHLSTFSTLATRATTSTSPLTRCHTSRERVGGAPDVGARACHRERASARGGVTRRARSCAEVLATATEPGAPAAGGAGAAADPSPG